MKVYEVILKRVTPCIFFIQIKFSNIEFAQKCRKIEFHRGKSSFKGKIELWLFRQNRVSLETHKKEPECV